MLIGIFIMAKEKDVPNTSECSESYVEVAEVLLRITLLLTDGNPGSFFLQSRHSAVD